MEYTVKQIAKLMNMNEHTIRFYTDKGLLPCKRDAANRRIFDDESINWLHGIQCLRGCGVSLDDIKVYSQLCMSNDENALQKRYEFMLTQRQLAYDKLHHAQELVEYMEHKVSHYEDIISGKVEDDTNPATGKISNCCK